MKKHFGGIIEKVRGIKKHNPILFASHSNAKGICNVNRNLTDEQIRVIAEEFNGTIGMVEYTPFCTDRKWANKSTYEKYYFKHINYVKNLLGGVDHITVATDDMSLQFINGDKPPVYKHKEVAAKIKNLLIKNGYTDEETEKILYKNIRLYDTIIPVDV